MFKGELYGVYLRLTLNHNEDFSERFDELKNSTIVVEFLDEMSDMLSTNLLYEISVFLVLLILQGIPQY